ncbi:DUF4231 domain-containing protein [Verrucomicrobiota bacterium sgz303538]
MSETEHAEPALRDADFPQLYQASDSASRGAQKLYLHLVAAGLWLSLLGALLSMVKMDGEKAKLALAAVALLLFTLSLIITIVLKTLRPEKTWYGGRAAAESVKTRTWRYVCGAEPLQIGLPSAEADSVFLSDLKAIIDQRKYLAGAIAANATAEGNQITPRMREIRSRSMQERLAIYLGDRIQSQKAWYGKKAAWNKGRETLLFWMFTGAQILTALAALGRVLCPTFPITFSTFFAAVSASLLAWLQLKKHQELAQAYGIAAHELSLLAEQALHVHSESELCRFVAEAENAISREHTLWVARRDDA